MITQFTALMRKDLRLFFSDRRAVLMSFVAPIAIASFFGFIFAGEGQTTVSRIPVLAVDGDGSAISREIVASVTADKALAVKASTAEAARVAVRKGKATVAFVIPGNFGADAGRALFNSTAKPEIGLLYDPSHAAEMGMVQGILAGHVMEAVSKEMFGGQGGRQAIDDALAQIGQANGMTPEEKNSLRAMLQGVKGWNARNDSRKASGRRGG
jgi:ABC-2 type transport system permease protein